MMIVLILGGILFSIIAGNMFWGAGPSVLGVFVGAFVFVLAVFVGICFLILHFMPHPINILFASAYVALVVTLLVRRRRRGS